MSINNVAVIGVGTMGNGIAHVFAQNGFSVKLIDVSDAQLKKAISTIEKNLQRLVSKNIITAQLKDVTLENLQTYTSIENGVKDCDLVIEAATENIDLKLKIFSEIQSWAPEHCILATNTSSISITQIAAVCKKPSQVIGMHFMNPVPVMKLVEVIKGYHTSDEVTNIIVAVCAQLGKTPCEVNDYPGFVANRILMPMINEAIYTLHEGVAGVEEIDQIMRLGMAHPMGPLQLADFIGLDVCLAILEVLHKGFGNPKYAPCSLLVNMVMAKVLGRKSGEGFYKYEEGSKDVKVSARFIS